MVFYKKTYFLTKKKKTEISVMGYTGTKSA